VLEGDGAVWVPYPPGDAAGPVRWSAVRAPEAEGMKPGEAAALVVRPESLAFAAAGDPQTPQALAGRVIERRYAGPVTYYQVALAPGGEVEVLAPSGAAAVGDAVRVAPEPRGPAPRIFRRNR